MAQDISDIDSETARDLMSDFELHHNNVELAVAELMVMPSDESLNQVFREVHTIKGNASMYGLSTIVQFLHAIEDVMGALRSRSLHISKELAEVIMMAMDRARDLHQNCLFNAQLDNLNLENIQQALHNITKARSELLLQKALQDAINELTNHFVPEEPVETAPKSSEYFSDDMQIKQDLLFFRSLALQLDKQNIFWDERSQLLFRWAQKMNARDNYPVDPSQLAVATYLHDLGMSFLPSDILNKSGKLTVMESQQLQKHPHWGMELVTRMHGWQEAGLIIQQHHERFDGQGYPAHIAGDAIHQGARILAILDAFYAIIHERADRARRRSILRGVSEINACAGSQFCPKWVDIFNQVIREESHEGLLGQ
jgi:HD-GYP domain-containing protein (c-di-GMP phosphodiesterase class II)